MTMYLYMITSRIPVGEFIHFTGSGRAKAKRCYVRALIGQLGNWTF